jgi:hypothetical protein
LYAVLEGRDEVANHYSSKLLVGSMLMRKVVICVAGLMIVGMLIVPPWMGTLDRPTLRRSEPYGYCPLWQAPPHREYWSEQVDYGRLGLQVGAVVVVAGVLLVVLPRKKA